MGTKNQKISPQGQYLLVLLFLYIVWGSAIQNKQLHTVTVTYYIFHVCVYVWSWYSLHYGDQMFPQG